MVAGSDYINLPAETIIVRLELTGGGRTRADFIWFELLADSGVEEQQPYTWGRIKSLWK
jgi:hypothetical protein